MGCRCAEQLAQTHVAGRESGTMCSHGGNFFISLAEQQGKTPGIKKGQTLLGRESRWESEELGFKSQLHVHLCG